MKVLCTCIYLLSPLEISPSTDTSSSTFSVQVIHTLQLVPNYILIPVLRDIFIYRYEIVSLLIYIPPNNFSVPTSYCTQVFEPSGDLS